MRRAERSRDSYSTSALISPERERSVNVRTEGGSGPKWICLVTWWRDARGAAHCTSSSHTLMYNKKARSLCGSTPSKNCLHVIFNCGQLASFAPWLPILRKTPLRCSFTFFQSGWSSMSWDLLSKVIRKIAKSSIKNNKNKRSHQWCPYYWKIDQEM
jgi:hypothetical protein